MNKPTTRVYHPLRSAAPNFALDGIAPRADQEVHNMSDSDSQPAQAGHDFLSFRFMDLLVELRIHISEFAIRATHGGLVSLETKPPSITQVSRQLRIESLPIYYDTARRYEFTLKSIYRGMDSYIALLKCWTRSLTAQHEATIQELTLNMDIISSDLLGSVFGWDLRGNSPMKNTRFSLKHAVENGVEIEYIDTLSQHSKARLEQFMKEIRQNEEYTGLVGGTALVFAVEVYQDTRGWRNLKRDS